MDDAEARSRGFQLLALGFAHPGSDMHALMVAGEYQAALAQLGIVATVPAVVEDLGEFEAAFIRLFQVGSKGRPQVSLNAADHQSLEGSENRPQFLLGYSGWYRHFGLKTADGEGANELPDHLTCQLEFMCWLAHLEAVNDDPSGYRLAQRDFLQRHLLPFLEALLLSLEDYGEGAGIGPFYGALADAARELALGALAEFASDPDQLVARSTSADDINVVNLWE